jgi:GTPase SAR1 family protein
MTAPTTPPIPSDPNAIRIVLFGMPDAGKSSLLGALSQASLTQPQALQGELTDLSDGLAELRHRVYDGRARETLEEIRPYTIRFQPRDTRDEQPLTILYDCDGRVANELLTGKKDWHGKVSRGSLAEAIRQADGLILVVDASAAYQQVDADLAEFFRFLNSLEKHRIRDLSVGSLPVFLVLSKCDVLARGTKNHAEWQERIAGKMRDLGQRFRSFLQQSPGRFGSLDLYVHATAVKQPGWEDFPENPREPVGVAGLFHDAIERAELYRSRTQQSARQLRWTMFGSGLLVASMAVGGAFLTMRPQESGTTNTLVARVETIQASEGGSAANRLVVPALERRLRELDEVEKSPDFAQLPEGMKEYVHSRVDEGQAYLKYREQVNAVPSPLQARTRAELDQIAERYSHITVPEAYRQEWTTTDAYAFREKRLNHDIPGLKNAVSQLTDYFHSLKNRGAALLLKATDLDPAWERQVNELLANADNNRPFAKSDPVLGPAYLFDEPSAAAEEWTTTQRGLRRLLDMSKALGILGDAGNSPLAASEPPTGTDLADYASKRWKSFRSLYPDAARWSLADLPDVARPEVAKRVRRSLDQAYRDGQKLLQDRLLTLNSKGTEEPSDWPRLADYLLTPPLQDYRQRTTFLARLADPRAEDPIGATANFLNRTQFDLSARQFTLRIPDSLSDQTVRPAGDLTIVWKAEGKEAIRHTFKLTGDPQRENQSLLYTFRASDLVHIDYRPGQTFYLELPVKRGDREQLWTWNTARTRSFPFESLFHSPRWHDANQAASEGVIAEGVAFTSIEGTIPTIPPLVPSLREKK